MFEHSAHQTGYAAVVTNRTSDSGTPYFGTLSVVRAFAPALAGGAVLNVLSVLCTRGGVSGTIHASWPSF